MYMLFVFYVHTAVRAVGIDHNFYTKNVKKWVFYFYLPILSILHQL